MNSVSLPFGGDRLESVVHFGNGKDADLKLIFADGRCAVLSVTAVQIQIDGGVVVEVSSGDDLSLLTEYRAPGLTFHSGRFGLSTRAEDLCAEFLAEARSWLATGGHRDLMWVGKAQIRLTSSPTTRLVSNDEQ